MTTILNADPAELAKNGPISFLDLAPARLHPELLRRWELLQHNRSQSWEIYLISARP